MYLSCSCWICSYLVFQLNFPCSSIFFCAIRLSSRTKWCWLLKLTGVVIATKWIIVAQHNNSPICWLQPLWIRSNPSWCFTRWIDRKWFPEILLTFDSQAVQLFGSKAFPWSWSQNVPSVFQASISACMKFKKGLFELCKMRFLILFRFILRELEAKETTPREGSTSVGTVLIRKPYAHEPFYER